MELTMTQSARYSEYHAQKANLTLDRLGIPDWNIGSVRALQTKVGTKPVDGWFGPKSIAAWKAWAKKHDACPVGEHERGRLDDPNQPVDAGQAIINGIGQTPPAGLRVVNYLEPGGIPAELDDTSPRKHHKVTQFVLHRGWSGSYKEGRNFAQKTEDTLDARGLSSTWSMDIDGVLYQHFDPAIRRGRHATHHNVQSDSVDIGGPFTLKAKPAPGQVKTGLLMAIGVKDDGLPPLKRKYATVRCWSLTPEQKVALIAFVPWWCNLRGIPLTACSDWRCFRIGGVGVKDPVTDVRGILAHTQISGPGQRVDGILPLQVLLDAGESTGIRWRTGEQFFAT